MKPFDSFVRIFQSTRPSRASTQISSHFENRQRYFNPQGPHGPRRLSAFPKFHNRIFQSTRPSRASTPPAKTLGYLLGISIHKALTGLDLEVRKEECMKNYFNPQGPHGPRRIYNLFFRLCLYFNPQGPHGPRLRCYCPFLLRTLFQSTRPSRASTLLAMSTSIIMKISIHKALTGLDLICVSY